MTNTSTAATSPGPLAQLRQSLELVQHIASTFTSSTTHNGLNTVEHIGEVPLSSVAADDLTTLIDRGHIVQLRIKLTTWQLTLRRGGGDVTDAEGPTAEAVDQSKVADLEGAINGRDFIRILDLLQEHSAKVMMRVTNDPELTGTHWISTHTDLQKVAQSNQWIPLARQLSTGPTGLLVDDLDDAVLTNQSFTVYGPNCSPASTGPLDASRRQAATAADDAFRINRSEQGAALPSPALFTPLKEASGTSSAITTATATIFRDLACLLTWALLANSHTPGPGGVHVCISGARELDVDVRPLDGDATSGATTTALLDMYRWVATSPEVDRLYFVQQALTLAIVNPEDIQTAAAPAFRTAKSLYDLSRRNSVAEVMSSRRSAREIALSASRSAATQARDASGKALERTVLLVSASAGVVIARLQASLPPGLTIGLLMLVTALCAASWTITEHVTIKSARNGFDRELDDLEQYRDSLSQADLEEVRKSGAIGAARADLIRATISARWTYGIAGGAAAFTALVVLCAATNTVKPPPSKPTHPTTTSSSTPSGPPTSSDRPTPSPSRR